MMDAAVPDDVGRLSFEAAMKELEAIVRDLESGELELEKSIAAYERGARLKAHCEAKLAEARMKVEKITLDPEGRPTGAQPLED